MQAQVSLSSTCGGAELALEDRFVSSMNQAMSFQAVGLRKTGMADVTLVGFFSRVNSQMPFEFKGVRTSIGAMRTLIGSLTRVAP